MFNHIKALQGVAREFKGSMAQQDALFDQIGDARFVLIGEASHGTHEFYQERACITQRLIEEKNFTSVVVEADWPDAYRVNRYVRHQGHDRDAFDALDDFKRFPRWMWRNEVVRDFVEWLRIHNKHAAQRTGFYGMDIYSLHRSMQAVIDYLNQVDPKAALRAKARYSCFDNFGTEPQQYGMATEYGVTEPCEDAVIAQLQELQSKQQELAGQYGLLAEDAHFYAQQNARLAVNAEKYYRAMFRGRDNSWNLRDTHMVDTITSLFEHQQHQAQAHGSEPAKIVVWAHNSHLGDARATEVGQRGQINVGQLMRERYPAQTFIIGFSTYQGEVLAASDWDGAGYSKKLKYALSDSHEDLLNQLGLQKFWLNLQADAAQVPILQEQRLERYIGVIYAPTNERWSHYLDTRLDQQYDALIYLDKTHAVKALDKYSTIEYEEDLPETYPSGQ